MCQGHEGRLHRRRHSRPQGCRPGGKYRQGSSGQSTDAAKGDSRDLTKGDRIGAALLRKPGRGSSRAASDP